MSTLQSLHRDMIQERRRRWHRQVEAVRQLERGSEQYDITRLVLAGTVNSWVGLLEKKLPERAAAGDELAARAWHAADIGEEYTGLKSIRDTIGDMDNDGALSVDACIRAGQVAEEVSVEYYDLPVQPPVVDEMWTPADPPIGELPQSIKEVSDL